MIGVFICKCGGNISGTVDINKVRREIRRLPDVSAVYVNEFLCSKPGLDLIKSSILKRGLKRVVVAACTPHMHEEMFRNAVTEAGLNGYLLERANIREQCSWVHSDVDKATRKTIDLIRGGVYRAKKLKQLKSSEASINRRVMVIGGGIAGIVAALQLADMGREVILVEKRPSIGGRMAQLSKVFPTLDCAPCVLSPLMAQVGAHPHITLMTLSEVEEVTGGPGNFYLKIRVKKRGVDVEKCVKCKMCERICPVTVPNEFEEELYNRKAVYLPFDQAIPSVYTIDFEHCTRCGKCAEVCPSKAINLEDEDKEVALKVGSIIIATGFDLMDNEKIRRCYPRHPQCITSLQLERLIENELAAGKVLKTPEGRRVKSLAFILCVGSRDPHLGVAYCSRVCCPYSIKEAILLKKALPYLDIWMYFTDIRMTGRYFEEFYGDAKKMGIKFIRGKPGAVTIDKERGKVEVIAEDADIGYLFKNHVDMVILCPAIIPSERTVELADILRVPIGSDDFVAEKHPKLSPIATLREGVFAAGTALGPKDIPNSVTDGRAAASQAFKFIGSGKRVISPLKPKLVGECNECGVCVEVCPLKAISIEDGLHIDLLSCDGCGACIPVCEKHALELAHYTREQLEATIEGILSKGDKDIVVLGLFGDRTAYPTADAAGTSNLQYPHNIRIMRVPSTALLDSTIMLKGLACGADGVMISETEGSKEAELTLRQVEIVKKKLSECEIDERRIVFQPLLLPMSKTLPPILANYTHVIKRLGKLGEENRQKISQITE